MRRILLASALGAATMIVGCESTPHPITLNNVEVGEDEMDQQLAGTSATLRVDGLGCPM